VRSLVAVLALCAALALLLLRLSRQRRLRERRELTRVLRGAADGTLASFEWHDFLGAELADPELREIRSHLAGLPARYPPEAPDQLCGPQGREILRHYLGVLGGRSAKGPRSTTGR
jgi:hypothetical protein